MLWYSLSNSSSTYSYHSPLFDCKVDILTPGVMNIPNVPPGNITTISKFPLMPLLPQLLLKLQAWQDHRLSRRSDFRVKEPTDIADIDALLEIAAKSGVRVRAEESLWVPRSMIVAAESRVRSYIIFASTRSTAGFKKLGFNVSTQR